MFCSFSWKTWSRTTPSSTSQLSKVEINLRKWRLIWLEWFRLWDGIFKGLAVLADSYPEKILEKLLQDFQHGPSLPTSTRERSIETRLKVGEVLMRACRAMGESQLMVPVLCRVKSSKYSLYVQYVCICWQATNSNTPSLTRRSVPTRQQWTQWASIRGGCVYLLALLDWEHNYRNNPYASWWESIILACIYTVYL